jgi:hypothetical protein
MTNYSYEDTLLAPLILFLSNDYKLQYIAGREIDTAHIQESLFEFRDTGFVRVFNHMILPYPAMEGTFLREVGGYKFGEKVHANPYNNSAFVCIEYFIDSSFTPYFCFNDKIKTPWGSTQGPDLVGTNLQNFIFLAHTGHEYIFTDPLTGVSYPVGIVHWDGSKVSKEIGLWGWTSPYPYDSFILQNINFNAYLILCPYTLDLGSPNSTLFIGTKK